MRRLLEARRAAERRLLPRPSKQAMERRLRALAKKGAFVGWRVGGGGALAVRVSGGAGAHEDADV